MIENTIENKKKFMSLYVGQPVYSRDRYPGGENFKMCSFFRDDVEETHVLLKSLSSSSITDEDAIELVKIHGYIKNQLTEENGRSLINSIIKGTDIPFFYVKKEKFGHMIDYLRSRGYALPYMGASVGTMIEWGWIKLKED